MQADVRPGPAPCASRVRTSRLATGTTGTTSTTPKKTPPRWPCNSFEPRGARHELDMGLGPWAHARFRSRPPRLDPTPFLDLSFVSFIFFFLGRRHQLRFTKTFHLRSGAEASRGKMDPSTGILGGRGVVGHRVKRKRRRFRRFEEFGVASAGDWDPRYPRGPGRLLLFKNGSRRHAS